MDDARLERLLTRSGGARPEKPKRNAGLSLGKIYDEDQSVGHHASDMLKTRPRPSSPRRPHTELSPAGKPLPEHGTHARYKHHGCRCEKCRQASSEAHKRYVAENYEKRRASQAAYRARKRAEKRQAA